MKTTTEKLNQTYPQTHHEIYQLGIKAEQERQSKWLGLCSIDIITLKKGILSNEAPTELMLFEVEIDAKLGIIS